MKEICLEGKIEEINSQRNYVIIKYLDFNEIGELKIDLDKYPELEDKIHNSKFKKEDFIKIFYIINGIENNYTKIKRLKNPQKLLEEFRKIKKENYLNKFL